MRAPARRAKRRSRRGISTVIIVLGIVGVAAVGLLLWKKFGKSNMTSTANTEKARYEDSAGHYQGQGSPGGSEDPYYRSDPSKATIPPNPYGGSNRYGDLQGLRNESDAAYSRLVGTLNTSNRNDLEDLQKQYSTTNGAYNDKLREYGTGGW